MHFLELMVDEADQSFVQPTEPQTKSNRHPPEDVDYGGLVFGVRRFIAAFREAVRHAMHRPCQEKAAMNRRTPQNGDPSMEGQGRL
jgi:hypothetical protein